jgi:DNA-binding NtrC family response regulator
MASNYTSTVGAPVILLIDDDRNFLDAISELLTRAGYRTMTARSGEEGLETLGAESGTISLVLLDIRMPGMSGHETLEKIVRFHSRIPVIMLTGENAIDLVVRAMKLGATNYIYKGAGGSELLAAVQAALEQSSVGREIEDDLEKMRGLGIIGRSQELRRILNDAELCARSMISVLITGETGVGKDLLAQAIHKMSPRRNKPFILIDVPNIPATMFESELFGHTRGAFTGAVDSKAGLVQAASGGTLFLDEIGEFPIELQAKFLRVIDSQQVRRLGSVSSEEVDVRIISATNRNLLEAVGERIFREDLLYRLRGIEIHIPPLRERREDITPLAEYFLATFTKRNDLGVKRFGETAIDLLQRQRWSGNVRELRRATEALAVMTPGEVIEHTDVARVLDRSDASRSVDSVVVRDYSDVQHLARQTKKEELMKVLDRNEWNITRASAELGIDRSTLSKQMKSLGISKPRLGSH